MQLDPKEKRKEALQDSLKEMDFTVKETEGAYRDGALAWVLRGGNIGALHSQDHSVHQVLGSLDQRCCRVKLNWKRSFINEAKSKLYTDKLRKRGKMKRMC